MPATNYSPMRADCIAGFVNMHIFQTKLAEAVRQPLCARSFAKWRSGNRRHLHLPVCELRFLGPQPGAGSPDFRRGSQPGNLLLNIPGFLLART
jgi:hypothetical protein